MSDLVVLVLGAVAGSLVFGVSGFAFALTASAIWLQRLPPAQVVPLAVVCPLMLNVVTLPALRRDIRVAALWPFLVGGTFGVPLGVLVVLHGDRLVLARLIAVILIAYSAFALVRRRAVELRLATAPGRVADGGVGLVGGILGGIAGLSAVLPSLWIGMRGWTKPEQRGLLQSYGFYTQALTITVFAGIAGFDAATLEALAICLPIAVVGSLVGFRLFRRMSGDAFRRAVLAIVLAGGIGLLVRTL